MTSARSSLRPTGAYLDQSCDAIIDRCLNGCISFRGLHGATTAAPITRRLDTLDTSVRLEPITRDDLSSALKIHSDFDCLFFAKARRSRFECQRPLIIGLKPNNSRAWDFVSVGAPNNGLAHGAKSAGFCVRRSGAIAVRIAWEPLAATALAR